MDLEKFQRYACYVLATAQIAQIGMFIYARHTQRQIDKKISETKLMMKTPLSPLEVIRHDNGTPIIG